MHLKKFDVSCPEPRSTTAPRYFACVVAAVLRVALTESAVPAQAPALELIVIEHGAGVVLARDDRLGRTAGAEVDVGSRDLVQLVAASSVDPSPSWP